MRRMVVTRRDCHRPFLPRDACGLSSAQSSPNSTTVVVDDALEDAVAVVYVLDDAVVLVEYLKALSW